MELTIEQTAFVAYVGRRWSEGATQQRIANELGMKKSTLRTRVKYYGYQFARAGKLPAIRSPELPETFGTGPE